MRDSVTIGDVCDENLLTLGCTEDRLQVEEIMIDVSSNDAVSNGFETNRQT